MSEPRAPASRAPAAPVIEAALRKNERVLWSGRPIPRYAMWSGVPGDNWLVRGFALVVGVAILLLFSLPGAVFSLQCVRVLSGATAHGSPLVAAAVLPLSLAGMLFPLYWKAVRPRVKDYRVARDLHYVITNRRAMIVLVRGGRIEDVRSRDLRQIGEIRLKWLRRDGSGSVLYDKGGEAFGDSFSRQVTTWDVGFEGVPNARHVLEALRAAIRG